MLRFIRSYIDSFRGFKKEIWVLTLASFVNRAGTMVIPFLSLYLTADKSFTLQDVGWVMTAFGVGSTVGSWLGGKFTDQFGPKPVMIFSLLGSGLLFIALQFIEGFWAFCFAIFLVMSVADLFRPAIFVSLRNHSKEENRTRSVTLVRLAINLGFSVGPAAGGFVIANLGYFALFWVDGITCLGGALVIWLLLSKTSNENKADEEVAEATTAERSPYQDTTYLIFLGSVFLVAFAFLQYFSSVPLYYRDIHFLSEQNIGLLLGLNGAVIFLVEMPIIRALDGPMQGKMKWIQASILMIALSFVVVNLSDWKPVLVIGILLMTFGEILNFPLANRFAMDRSNGAKVGSYMGLYTVSFSIAHMLGHNGGLVIVDHFGYEMTWWIMAALLLLSMGLLWIVQVRLNKEKL